MGPLQPDAVAKVLSQVSTSHPVDQSRLLASSTLLPDTSTPDQPHHAGSILVTQNRPLASRSGSEHMDLSLDQGVRSLPSSPSQRRKLTTLFDRFHRTQHLLPTGEVKTSEEALSDQVNKPSGRHDRFQSVGAVDDSEKFLDASELRQARNYERNKRDKVHHVAPGRPIQKSRPRIAISTKIARLKNLGRSSSANLLKEDWFAHERRKQESLAGIGTAVVRDDLTGCETSHKEHFPGDIYHRARLKDRKPLPPCKFGLALRSWGSESEGSYEDLEEESEAGDQQAAHIDDPRVLQGRKQLGRRTSVESSDSYESILEMALGEDAWNFFETPSNKGLKSWTSKVERSEDAGSSSKSVASGGASNALSRPLLELEDLELETFLQNFGRHTREVRVPSSSFKRQRMPQWSDFRISHEEKEATAAGGKRASVLEHVDKGLRSIMVPGDYGSIPGTDVEDESKLTKKRSKRDGKGKVDRLTAEESFAPSQRISGAPGAAPSSERAQTRSKEESVGAVSRRAFPDKEAPNASRSSTFKKKGPKRGKGALEDEPEEDWDLVVPSARVLSEPDQVPELIIDANEEQVDGIAFCIAYILALVERLAPEELDDNPVQEYREGKLRSHVERLYLIAPFWEKLAYKLRRLYRWEDPKTTAAAAMIYFVLWLSDLIPTAFLLMIMYYIMRFKYFPPSESYLHERVRQRMARGKEANKMSERLRRRSRLDLLNIYRRWAVKYGAETQSAAGILADFHEKVKNLILWRNPAATQRSLILIGCCTIFVTFASAHLIVKTTFLGIGISFFCLFPLQSHYPRYRRPLSPVWWVLAGAPTDAQFAVKLLRERYLKGSASGQSNLSPLGDDTGGGGKRSKADGRPGREDLAGHWSRAGTEKEEEEEKEEEGAQKEREEEDAGEDEVEGDERLASEASSKPRKLGSFFCQYHGLPGRLRINERCIYFSPLHSGAIGSGKRRQGLTALDEIGGLVKTKSIRLWFWSSAGLKVIRRNGKSPMLFANVQNRDEAFNLILAVGSEVWSKC
ncbi:hypothetical protein IE53DRAFT_380250 [Violaceomyces palustris]|uniref:Uncharacterized protein n=1 Tax=Violaceomyces palustris TaxID=1673888 RepID=A0ACD0NVM2_9BASI|nr:hypothetical protein IE53DRAFT_380250 [Violaceomyces palustris]